MRPAAIACASAITLLLGCPGPGVGPGPGLTPPPDPPPDAAPRPPAVDELCTLLDQVRVHRSQGFEPLRAEGSRSLASDKVSEMWDATLGPSDATETHINQFHGAYDWTTTWYADEGTDLVAEFRDLRRRLAECASVATLTEDDPLDFDEDGELDQFSWSGEDQHGSLSVMLSMFLDWIDFAIA